VSLLPLPTPLSPTGVATDLAKTKLHIRRIHFMAIIALVFILSQLVAASTSDVSQLWITSSLCVARLLSDPSLLSLLTPLSPLPFGAASDSATEASLA
jgi:hypothetical protein